MTSHDFLALLEPHADRQLAFLAAGQRIPAGYHVTEIKAHSVRSIDCGGMTSQWTETVLQLIPAGPIEDARKMTVGKFLSIYGKARESIEPDPNAEVRVEHAAPGQSAVSYLVEGIALKDDALEVRLAAPGVACKGADRSVGDVPVLNRYIRNPAAASGASSDASAGISSGARSGIGSSARSGTEPGPASGCCSPATSNESNESTAPCCG